MHVFKSIAPSKLAFPRRSLDEFLKEKYTSGTSPPITWLIAVAIAAVVLAIRAYIKAQNAEAESAKRAAEAAEKLKEQTDETK